MKANRILFYIIVLMYLCVFANVTTSFEPLSNDLTFNIISGLFLLALAVQAMTFSKSRKKQTN
ncbi:hypothetical protein [Alkalicoccobacillus plakortidis]|uniref:Uncharacterized protein n=1 Tax=Alkalicoccobacillus plakortidis TaxID=444060 RepID=A0ABT0XG72_9BACI|nr:hypothetical protein [Alkalicoccobacillus plakortidis]MCM2674900.1 hypothetical protein [Alkalicoccobacillus plakortidis]